MCAYVYICEYIYVDGYTIAATIAHTHVRCLSFVYTQTYIVQGFEKDVNPFAGFYFPHHFEGTCLLLQVPYHALNTYTFI